MRGNRGYNGTSDEGRISVPVAVEVCTGNDTSKVEQRTEVRKECDWVLGRFMSDTVPGVVRCERDRDESCTSIPLQVKKRDWSVRRGGERSDIGRGKNQ